jgi:hypothetical protein
MAKLDGRSGSPMTDPHLYEETRASVPLAVVEMKCLLWPSPCAALKHLFDVLDNDW